MTNKAIQIRKIYRRAAFRTVNKSNGHYYFMDKKDGRIYRMSSKHFYKCHRLKEPHMETYAIPDTNSRIMFSQTFDTETNTFNLTEHES